MKNFLSTSLKPKILLVLSPNYSIKILQKEIDDIKSGNRDFTKSVDWRISAPLGILYIAGTMRKFGYNVQIYDLHRAFYLCRENGYFKEKNLSNFFEDFFEDFLKNNKIDVLGISCLFNVASTTVEEMGVRCKKISPKTIIVLGGHYPTNMYHEILRKGVCDYVILGEAEEEFVWLLNNLNEPLLKNKIYKNPHIVDLKSINNPDKNSAIIQNLDTLAMPAWDLLPNVEDYIERSLHAERFGTTLNKKRIKSAGILTTRGCPMGCTFCAAHAVHGRKMRVHSIDYIMKHIDWLVDNYDINHLLIEDDMFNFSTERTIQFCNAIFEKYSNHFTIEFPNGLAVWNLNEDVISHLKKIGLKTVTIAIESGNQYVQKNIIKKNLDLSLIKQKVELLKKYNIDVRAFYIVGFVGETLKMMRDTIKFALDLNIDWSEIKIFTPLVGSEMYNTAKVKGYLIGDTSEHVYGRCRIRTPDFTPRQVEDLQYDANIRINFINNKNLKEGKFDVAESVFSKLLSVYPNHLFAQWGLWKALEGQEKKEEAEQALKKLIDMSKRNKKNRFLLKKYNIQLP
jgi:radical SAM superfamily enzyme YgiQ (UPF0313 family)